jgi:hypothetical protein
MKKLVIAIIASLILTLMVSAAFAQDEFNGSIRGTVYLDKNGDGKCVDTGEPTHPGVPIEFVSNDGKWSTYLATGDDGTYGLVAAAYGTWTVSARPNANDFVVTSQATKSVFIGSDEPLALNIDFCIQDIDGPVTTGAGTNIATFTNVVYLPASGAAAKNLPYYIAFATGFLLFAAGAIIYTKRKDA